MQSQPGSSYAKQFNSTDLKHQLCHFFSILQVLGGAGLLDNNSSSHSLPLPVP